MNKIKGLGLFEEIKAKPRAIKYIDHSVSEFKSLSKEHISNDKTKFILVFKKKGFKFKNGDTLKNIEKDISKIINRKVIVVTKIEEEKIEEKKIEEQKESSLKKGLKIFSEAWKEADKINEAKQERKKYEEVNNPKKKGGLFTFLGGAVAAGAAKNRLSPPTVVFNDPNTVLVGMNAQGIGSWKIKYKTRGSSVTRSATISRNTRGSTAGGGFTVTWPS